MKRASNLAVIGLGNRTTDIVKTFQRFYPAFKLAGVVDLNESDVRQRLAKSEISMDSTQFIYSKNSQYL